MVGWLVRESREKGGLRWQKLICGHMKPFIQVVVVVVCVYGWGGGGGGGGGGGLREERGRQDGSIWPKPVV